MTDTATQNSTLHMVQMWLDTRRLTELARALHLPLRHVDENYLTHCALAELFGDRAPGPFCVEDSPGRHLRVLAYGSEPDARLHEIARKLAGPMVYRICDWDRLASKPMPESFEAGTRLRFTVRACPVVRKSSAGKYHSAGAEVDAFLSRVWEVDDRSVPVNREDVYRQWLLGQFERRGGADLAAQTVRLERFSLERMLRRSDGGSRKTTVIKRPAATLSGRLQVTDGRQFRELIRRGVGRHKTFGFGMLKVQPPGR